MNKYVATVAGTLCGAMSVFVMFLGLLVPIVEEPHTFVNYLFDVGMFFLGLCSAFSLVNSFFSGKRFDKKFKDILVNDPYIDDELISYNIPSRFIIQSRSFRSILYAVNMVFPGKRKKVYFLKEWFGNYNFRKNGRWIDVVLSYGCVLCIFVCFTSFGLFTLVRLYNDYL